MKVSVIMITYGHEKFIQEAIEGVLIQKCNFPVELIIANDNSPDETDRLVNQYLENKTIPPNIVVNYVKHDLNKGMNHNFLWALGKSKGQYIALCEGDDFWTDPAKLQSQVNFMDNNLDFSMCFHDVDVLVTDKGSSYVYDKPQKDILLLQDIVKKHYMATCTVLFRNGYFKDGLPEWYPRCISGDLPLEILLASKGKTKYLDFKMACYRRHPGGITQSESQIAKTRSGYIFMYSNLASELKGRNSIYLHFVVWRLRLGYLKQLLKKLKSKLF